MIWAAMSSAGVGPLCFLKSSQRSHLPEHFRALHASFCWQVLRRCWFNLPAGLGTCPHCQRYQKLVQWPWCYSACLASKLVWPEPRREYMLNLCVLVKFSNTSLLQNQSLQCSDTCLKIPMGGMNGKILSRPLKIVNGNCCTLYSTISKLLFSITMKVNGDIFDKQEFQWIFKFSHKATIHLLYL